MTTERAKTSNAENISSGFERGTILANLSRSVSSAQMTNMVTEHIRIQADQITDLCASGGMRPVSLDSVPLAQEFMNLCGQENQKWFWSGGRINGQTLRGSPKEKC